MMVNLVGKSTVDGRRESRINLEGRVRGVISEERDWRRWKRDSLEDERKGNRRVGKSGD